MRGQTCGFIFRLFMKVCGSLDLVVGRGFGTGVGWGFGDEVVKRVDLEVGGNVVSINMSNIKSMWRWVTV